MSNRKKILPPQDLENKNLINQINKNKKEIALKKALLIEDNSICQKIYTAWLSELNREVNIASNAVEAHNHFTTQTYDVIVTDLGLPDKPGIEVIKNIRCSLLNQYTPIIVVSAHVSTQIQQECIQAGANVVLTKPVSKEVYSQALGL